MVITSTYQFLCGDLFPSNKTEQILEVTGYIWTSREKTPLSGENTEYCDSLSQYDFLLLPLYWLFPQPHLLMLSSPVSFASFSYFELISRKSFQLISLTSPLLPPVRYYCLYNFKGVEDLKQATAAKTGFFILLPRVRPWIAFVRCLILK